MDQNPYESPRTGEALEEQALAKDGSIRQLLTEIRDAQYEMLRMNREAMQRASGMYWYRLPLSLIPALIFFAIFFFFMIRQRSLPQIPPRPATRAVP